MVADTEEPQTDTFCLGVKNKCKLSIFEKVKAWDNHADTKGCYRDANRICKSLSHMVFVYFSQRRKPYKTKMDH